MRAWLAIVTCCVAGCGADDSGVVVELSSEIEPLDSAAVTVLGAGGAIVRDQLIADGATLELPRRVRIASGDRAERIRILVWGSRDSARVAFGQSSVQLAPGTEDEVAIRLAAPPADCDDDGVPDIHDGCPSIADAEQRDADGDGTTDACVPGLACPANHVSNPDFELGTMGWQPLSAEPAILTRITGGYSGEFAARLCKQPTGTTSAYTLDDRPSSVTTPAPGGRYRVDAWVRSDSGLSQQIDLRVGELSVPGENPIDSEIVSLAASAAWQLLSTPYTITAAAGASTLDVRVRVLAAADGACFDVDDICVQQLAASCP